MLALGLDTSGRYLNIALIKDQKLVDFVHEDCYKKQSEQILPKLEVILNRNHVTPSEVDTIVVSEGPGSYTGIRIAMTLAKVWTRMRNIKLYKLDSLQLVAGKKKDTVVFMDAHANRGYFGAFSNGKKQIDDCILTNEEFKKYRQEHPESEYRGDNPVLTCEDKMNDINQHFLDLKDEWLSVDPIDPLKAKYLKDASEYLKKS